MEPSQARGALEETLSRALMGDRLLQAGVIVWIVTLLPSFVPIFSTETRRQMLDSLAQANREHFKTFGDPETQARIAQYEMAFRMQSSVPELMDMSDEQIGRAHV